MRKRVWVGVDVGGTKTAVLISAEPPQTLGRIEFPTRPTEGPGPAIESIRKGIRVLLARHRRAALEAIGVSCGGPLDHVSGVIQAPPNLPTWVDVPIKQILEREFEVVCRVENDANAGAVAEHRYGAGRGCRHMIFITMGTGFGAGIIADGRLYHGANDFAGEIGHVRLTRSGPVGYHKAGSVEGWVSGGGLAQVAEARVRAAVKRGKETLLAAPLRKNTTLSAREVAEAAAQGDALAVGIIRATGRRLGAVLAILVDILNPERIVIGGLAMRLGDDLWKPALCALHREALHYSTAVCQVVPASLGERIGDVAALCVAQGF